VNRGRVGEERRGKETDGCPLTGIVMLHLVFGSTIVMVLSSLGKFLTVDLVRTLKGQPN
jgi:hypothetical protein